MISRKTSLNETNPLTYVSLFSSGGLGCFGFKLQGFECLATAELLPRRMAVQRANHVADPEGYFEGDLTDETLRHELTKKVRETIDERASDLTVLVATPPCQGISVANHKKKNELPRNSLVIESIRLIASLRPRFFVLENVRGFLSAACQDVDGRMKSVRKAIGDNLANLYNVESLVANLKEYGSPSSRTRTLVLGVRKDIDVPVASLLPAKAKAQSLKELIGGLPRLSSMGEVSSEDFLHGFRPYAPHMRAWIENLGEGESAFSQSDPVRRPHRYIKGVRVENVAKNGDKYRRNVWDRVPPCVHTRNDILASQSTVHPEDDRVFSIRELMLMMGVPASFKWSVDESRVARAGLNEQKRWLKVHEPNIRQCLGEGVPTPIFEAIAENIAQAEESVQENLAA